MVELQHGVGAILPAVPDAVAFAAAIAAIGPDRIEPVLNLPPPNAGALELGNIIKSTEFNFLAYSIARYDHLQAILFCPLPTCGESPIDDLRTQSRKIFRDGFFFTKLVEGSSSGVLKDLLTAP